MCRALLYTEDQFTADTTSLAIQEYFTRPLTVAKEFQIKIIHQTKSLDNITEQVRRIVPDLLIAILGDERFIGYIKQLLKASPRTKIVVVSPNSLPSNSAETLYYAFQEGRVGYTNKDSGIEKLFEAIQAMQYKSRFQDGSLINTKHFEKMILRNRNPMTPREKDVFSLLAKGLSNRAIANELSISYQTVKTHVSKILQKLEVESRESAIVIARDEHLVGM